LGKSFDRREPPRDAKGPASAGLSHSPGWTNQQPSGYSPEIELSLGKLASVWGTSEILREARDRKFLRVRSARPVAVREARARKLSRDLQVHTVDIGLARGTQTEPLIDVQVASTPVSLRAPMSYRTHIWSRRTPNWGLKT
jgi:hypothetical protein